MRYRLISFVRLGLFFSLVAGSIFSPQFSVNAAGFSVTPITWNIMGLDSNNPNVGPNHFPVGVSVCNNTGAAATNVTGTFVWDTGGTATAAEIYNRAGTETVLSVPSLAAGACTDFYYEVEISRSLAPYDKTRRYHIDVTSTETGATKYSSPTPREIYVEHLISQSRNYVQNILLSSNGTVFTPIAAGGTMTLMVGNTYWIQVDGYTATQGYNQLEEFINFPNTIFQVLSVNTDYSADSSLPPTGYVPNPNDQLYADACKWDNDPASPTYRSCTGIDGKAGGHVVTTYKVKILQVPGAPLINPEPLSTLIYDFSGSSYHYNADFGVSVRYANIVNASISKSFSPKTIVPNGTATLSFTVTNPGSESISNVNFTDNLPAGLTLANTTVVYTGCGALPSPSPLVINGPPQTLSFTNITVAGNSSCKIDVTVTASANNSYPNTTGHLYIDTTDTLSTASDTLVVSSQPAPPSSCTTRSNLATWTFENYTASTAINSGPFAASSLPGTGVTAGQASFGSSGTSTSAITNPTTYPNTAPNNWGNNLQPSTTGNSGNSWGINAGWLGGNPANPATATTPYFQFRVDGANNYGALGITTNYNMQGNWSNAQSWYVLFSTDGTNWSMPTGGSAVWNNANAWQVGGITVNTTTTAPTVYFRVYAAGAQNSTATMYLDTVNVTGCPRPTVPTLSKSFAPPTISQGGASTLSFTFTNPNATALAGISFSDSLPTGLTISNPNGLSTISCTTGSVVTAPTITATSATSTISMTGLQLSANASCSFSVSVKGVVAGSYVNTSGNITSTASGPNSTATGYGTSTLTVLAPPVINKAFTANPIFTGNSTALTFTIYNPNTSTALTNVNFTDDLTFGGTQTGLVVATPNGLSNTCGGTATATENTSTISLSGVNLAAGATCTVTVNVTGTTAGLKNNSVSVSSSNAGTGNTSTASVLVKTPAPAIKILKQVGPSATGSWSSFLTTTTGSPVYYKFSVENVGDVVLTGISVTDPKVTLTGCTWIDGNGTVLSPFNTLPVADADDNQVATCIVGPITGGAVSGLNINTATVSATSTTSTSSTAKYGTPALTLVKNVTESSFAAVGDLLHYSYVVTNTGGAPLLGPITVSDDKATVTCPAVTTVGDNDEWLDPADYPTTGTAAEGITCTATYTVTAGDVTTGTVKNIATAKDKDSVGNDITSNTASRTVYGPFDLSITKTNGVTVVNAGSSTTYTIRVTNLGPSAVTGAILSDPVVLGLTKTAVACSATTPGQCVTAPSVAELEAGTFALPSLAVNQFYEITVTATVSATSGSVTNTATVAAPAGGTDSNTGNNTATDTDTVTPVADLAITKTNGVSSVNAGGTTTYTVRVTNNGPSSVTGAVLSDPAVAGLDKSAVACSATTPGQCVTPPTVAELQSGTFALPALVSGQFYEITVTATVTAVNGSVTNTATIAPPAGTIDSSNTNDSADDTDTVTPVIDLSLDKQVTNATPAIGDTVTFTLVVANVGPSTATNVVVTDVVPTGYTYVPTSIGGGDARSDSDPSGAGLTWTINSLDPSASVNLTYQATVLGSGTYNNYAEITSQSENDIDSTAGNGQQIPDEDDDDTQVVTPASTVAPSIAKSFSPNPIALGGTSTLTFTITNPNAGTALNGVAFTDNLPAGMQVATLPNANTSGCGTPTFTPASGNTTLSFTGGTIAAGGTCTVAVSVTATSAGTLTNTTGSVTSTNGGTGNTATANLGVINAVKTVVATSEDSSSEAGAPRAVLIGEVVRYRMVLELPEGATTNLQLEDIIVANMAYLNDNSTRVAFVCNSGVSCASSSAAGIGTNPVISGNSSAITPTFVLPAASITGDTGNPYGDGVNPVFNLGTVTNNDTDPDAEYVVVEFNVLVRNTAANQDAATRGNNFTVNVNGSAVVSSTDNANSRVTIIEPVITAITKSVTTTPTDAGDAIQYQLQFTNSGTAPAFDITITDALNAVLTTPVTVSGSTTGGSCGSTPSNVSGSYTAPNVTATVTCLAVGGTATINISANVSITALAGYTFNNSASLTYTSLPGTGTAVNPTGSVTPGAPGTTNGERDGSGGTDNYTASSNTVTTTLASPTLAKTINPAGASYSIGSTIPYQITITVPEGVTGGPAANLVETIPTGLSYVAGSLSVTPQAGVSIGTAGPYTDANASFYDLTGQVMTLSFGSFTSNASAAATNRTITITFLARVDNVVGNQTGSSFTNSVDLVRTNPNGAGTLTINATAPAASVIEPDLNVTKAVSSSTPAYNSTLTYTLDVQHVGASAPAYDVHITDTIPGGLTGLTNVNVVGAPAGCATGITNNSTAFSLDVTIGSIPLGCSLSITYDVTVSGALGSTQTNSVAAVWTSQTGAVYERTGVDGPGGILNDYADTDSKPVTVTGPDLRIEKTDGISVYTPGSPVTYTITVYNDGNVTASGTVVDTFSASLTGVTWTCAGTGLATCGGSGTGDINDAVSIPPTETVTYTVNATILASATGDLINTATATLTSGTDPTPGNNSSTDTDSSGNLLPVADPDTNTAVEGGPAVTGNVLTNETSLGDTPTTVTAVDQGGTVITLGVEFTTAAGGKLTLNGDGTYSYTPPTTLPEGAVLTEVFNYTITDANGDTSSSTLTITVDRLPQANPDTNTATEGGAAVTGNTITNDDEGNTNATVTAADQGGTPITFGTPFTTTAGGTLTLNADGSYSYTPPATLPEGTVLTEVFNYTITDTDGDSSSSTLTITVDRLPVANPDTDTAIEGGPAVTGNTITNDDEGNTNATVTAAGQGVASITIGTPFTTTAGGTLTLNGDGTYSYTPPASLPEGGVLTEVFNYTITDADGDISSSTLTITIDRLPQANPDTNTAVEGGPAVTGNTITNDDEGNTNATVTAADQGGTVITIGTPFTTTSGGTLTLNPDGSYSYTPPAQGSVPPGGLIEVFNYTITDANGDISSSTLTITVDDNDLLPVADPDTNVATEGGPAVGDNVLTNETSLGDTPTTVTAADQGGTTITLGVAFTTSAGGSLTLNADGTYSYTPPAVLPEGGALTEVFNYTITDADGDVSSSTLTITVNRLPEANPDTNTSVEGGPAVTGNTISNDDEGNTSATVTAADQGGTIITVGTPFTTAAGGTLTLNADGSYSYTPPAQGTVPPGGLTEVFNYTITDANGDVSSSTLTITVTDTDLLPVADPDTNTAVENGPDVTGDVMANETSLGDTPTTVTDADQGGTPIIIGAAFTTAGGGTLTLNLDGTYTYTPPASVPPTGLVEVFNYTITDVDGDSDTTTLTITVNSSLIGVAKQASTPVEVTAGTFEITYTFLVENYGMTVLDNVQVTDDLNAAFPAPTTFLVQSVSAVGLTPNPGYNGNTVTDLLTGTDSLAVGDSGTITLTIHVVPQASGPFENTAVASGQCPTCPAPVTDDSQDGSEPDPDNDKDPTNDNDPTPVDFGPNLFDPPFGLKVVNALGLPVLRWTMVWINDSNIVAIDAQVSDPISVGTTYAGNLTCTPDGSATTTTLCTYEAPSIAYPRGRVVWVGNLAPDLGATNAANANNEIEISFDVTVNAGITSVQNTATIDSDRNGDGDFNDASEVAVDTVSSTWNNSSPNGRTDSGLPATGFAPNVVTDMRNFRHENYAATDVVLEVPGINVKMSVVGVPKKDGQWNVAWLGNQAGWLEGTAFPSWNGNSVLTGHVYLSNGLPGPFVNLGKLKYGDKIIVHAYGQKYTFEVRTNDIVEPGDVSALKHEEKPWLTLITCKEYDAATNSYRKRVVVRAVLVNVTGE